MLGVDGIPLFPLFWTDDHVVIIRDEWEILTLEERMLVHLLWQFDLMDYRKMFRLV